MSSENTEAAATPAAVTVGDIRDDYLNNFHRTCSPSKDNDDHRSLKAQLQGMNINDHDNCSPRDLADVPIEAMKHVASFLASPSRALFAVALDNNLSRRECQVIAGNQWATLDFGTVEKSLAEKLTDDHISAVLLCIDSVHTIKTLRLANCINITGVGLAPLRGSRVMEHIDLSLVPDHTSPLLDPVPPISQELVLPILNTIMGRGRLKVIEFPKAWRNHARELELLQRRDELHPFNQFLDLYMLSMNHGRGFRCKECEDEVGPNFSGEAQGTQCFVCYNCHDNYCEECIETSDSLMFCDKCERHYCDKCMESTWCECCNSSYCEKCEPLIYCRECDAQICSDCISVKSCSTQCNSKLLQCQCCAYYNNDTKEFSLERNNACDYCADAYCRECIVSGQLRACDGCGRDHCWKCAEREGLHCCSNYCFSGNDYHCDLSLCKHCRVGSSTAKGFGFNCRLCYEQNCPKLFQQHKVTLEENDRLHKENLMLKLKLQEAQEGVAAADVDMVMSQAGCNRKRAVKALKDHDSDLIDAIMSLV